MGGAEPHRRAHTHAHARTRSHKLSCYVSHGHGMPWEPGRQRVGEGERGGVVEVRQAANGSTGTAAARRRRGYGDEASDR